MESYWPTDDKTNIALSTNDYYNLVLLTKRFDVDLVLMPSTVFRFAFVPRLVRFLQLHPDAYAHLGTLLQKSVRRPLLHD